MDAKRAERRSDAEEEDMHEVTKKLHEAVRQAVSNQGAPLSLNSPESEEFVINSRGQKLHVRSSWPSTRSETKRDPRGLVVFLHGYASHINRPTHVYLAEKYNAQGMAYVGLDFHGHGYSCYDQREERALVTDYEHLIDDVFSLLKAIFALHHEYEPFSSSSYSSSSSSSVAGSGVGDDTGSVVSSVLPSAPPPSAAAAAHTNRFAPHWSLDVKCKAGTPFFLIGNSMGGAVAVLVANELQAIRAGLVEEMMANEATITRSTSTSPTSQNKSAAESEETREGSSSGGGTGGGGKKSKRGVEETQCLNVFGTDKKKIYFDVNAGKRLAQGFSGCVLASPACSVNKPNPVILAIMEYVIVPLFPSTSIPSMVNKNMEDSAIWKSRDYVAYVQADGYDNGGLSWTENIRFKTASQILAMSSRVEEEMSSVSFPFLIFHDPQDRVCAYAGVERLVSLAVTPCTTHSLSSGGGSTSIERNDNKLLVDMIDGRHDIITNDLHTFLETSSAWMSARV